MKKYTTFITTEKGEQKEISVWLDDETARAIDEANDPAITQFYILDKHQEDLIDLKETRRHISLDSLADQGHLIADENGDPAQYVERMEKILKMRKALSALTDKQYTVLIAYHIDKLSIREIGRRMGIAKNSVKEHLVAAEKKIKKFFA